MCENGAFEKATPCHCQHLRAAKRTKSPTSSSPSGVAMKTRGAKASAQPGESKVFCLQNVEE